MTQWFKQLVADIGMKVLMGPYAVYCEKEGNRGFTGGCYIETSHATFHSWDEESPGTIQLDVYTCSCLDKQIVFDSLVEFGPITAEYCFIDRDDPSGLLRIIEQGKHVW